MSDQTVLYALSTLAQTCAALAAFVGAIGLFRLQALRERQRASEQSLRASLIDAYAGSNDVMFTLSIDEIVAQAERLPTDPSRQLGAARNRHVAETLAAWQRFGPTIRRVSIALAAFEAWNLFVILISLGGFAHVPALTGAVWVPWLLWFIAIGTAVVSGVSVFIWLERG